MTKSRMKKILSNLIEHVSVGNGTKDTVEELLNYGFFPEELIRDFGFAKADIEAVCGPASDEEEMISVKVYRDTVAPELHGDNELTEIEVKESVLLDWFRAKIKENFYISGSGKPDRELLDDWLDNYSPFETITLYDWMIAAKEKEENPVKDAAFYEKAYQDVLAREIERQTLLGSKDPAYDAAMSWEDYQDVGASEIAGYYIANYKDDSYRQWTENLHNAEEIARYRKNDTDSEVSRILKALYGQKTAKEPARTDDEAFTFKSPEEMYELIQSGQDLYSPGTEVFVYQYNDDGAIHVYTGISAASADRYASLMKEKDESGWQAFLPGGGQIFGFNGPVDEPGSDYRLSVKASVMDWCNDHYRITDWVPADETYKSETRKFMEKVTFDDRQKDWIFTISSDGNVTTRILSGTKKQVAAYLVSCVLTDKDGCRNDWIKGTEKAEDVQFNDKDCSVRAFGMYRNDLVEYKAVPMSKIERLELDTPFG